MIFMNKIFIFLFFIFAATTVYSDYNTSMKVVITYNTNTDDGLVEDVIAGYLELNAGAKTLVVSRIILGGLWDIALDQYKDYGLSPCISFLYMPEDVIINGETESLRTLDTHVPASFEKAATEVEMAQANEYILYTPVGARGWESTENLLIETE
jgi:hypothetical protein